MPPPQDTLAVDHLMYDSADQGGHTRIVSDRVPQSSVMFGEGPKAPVLFEGVAHYTKGSRLFTKALTGSPFAYSHSPLDPVEKQPKLTGQNTGLVTVVATRNNARVLFAGSLAMFSNEFYSAPVRCVFPLGRFSLFLNGEVPLLTVEM